MALADAEQGVGSGEKPGDTSLRELLEGIRGRRSAHMMRLMRWLEVHDSGVADARRMSASHENTDADTDTEKAVSSAMSAEPESSGPSVNRPASATGGIAVIERIDVTPDLIRFRVPRPLDFDFAAGQSVKVGLGDIQRSYSIASAPHESFLEFFVELTPGGRMSEQLRHLNPGDRVSLGTAKGGFRFDETCPEQVMVATVTGINPFVSMVRDYLHCGRSGHRFHILHGASHQTEFGYHDELASLASAYPHMIRYVPTVSRPDDPVNAGWSGQAGRVDALVDDYLNRNELGPATTAIYTCGHSGMVDTVASRGRTGGFQVWTESYD